MQMIPSSFCVGMQWGCHFANNRIVLYLKLWNADKPMTPIYLPAAVRPCNQP